MQKKRLPVKRRALGTALSVIVLGLLVALVLSLGCGGSSNTATRESTSTQVGATSSSTASTAVTVPLTTPESARYQQALRETYEASNAILKGMEARNAPSDDPDAAKVFALRARAQAIIACKALIERQNDLADAAVAEMRKLLNRAAAIPGATVVELVEEARKASMEISEASTQPEQARKSLDRIIDILAPLVSPTS